MSTFLREDYQGSQAVISNQDVIIESDRDQTGVGDIVFRSAGVERARIKSDGSSSGWSKLSLGVYNVKDYGAKGDGATNDTANFQSAANDAAGGILFLPAGSTFLIDTVTIPANTVVLAHGAKVKARTGTFTDLVDVASGCRIYGLEVDGSKASHASGVGNGIKGAAVTDVVIADCYIHDCYQDGIQLTSGSAKYRIERNRIESCCTGFESSAIRVDASSNGVIADNLISSNTYFGGITVWGGNASGSSVIGITDVTVTGNTVSNLTAAGKGAGIFVALGERVTVTGNSVLNCTDVGIDFEGCLNCAATGNTVENCGTGSSGGALTVFYTSKYVSFAGNTVQQGSGYGAGFVAAGGGAASSAIQVNSNVFHTYDQPAVKCAAQGVTSSQFNDNQIVCDAATPAIYLLQSSGNTVMGNRVEVTGSTGIKIEGGAANLIHDNRVRTASDAAVAAGGVGGILILYVDGTWSAHQNTVKNNFVSGFFASVNDDWGSDATSWNLIEGNRVATVYRRASGAWAGKITNNVSTGNPNTAVTETTY